VEKVNRDLAADAALGSSQIPPFPHTAKGARRRRRRAHADAQGAPPPHRREIRRAGDALYSDKTSCFIETQMRFEDGRTGTVSADLKILEAKTYSVAAAARQAA